MFENRFNTKKTDPLVEAVMQAQQDGEMRRQAIAMVNEQFGVFNRNAVVREDLAEYDAAIEEAYKCMKEGEKKDEKKEDKPKADYSKMREKMVGKGKDLETTRKIVGEAKKLADKDYDKDGKIESPKDEVWGSRLRAAKMAGKLKEEEQFDEGTMTGIKLKDVKHNGDWKEQDVMYKSPRMKKAEKLDTIHNAHRGRWGTDDAPGIGSKKSAIDTIRHDEGRYRWKQRAKKRGYDMKRYDEETDYSAQDRAPVTKSAPKEDPSTPKSYPGAASTVSGPNPTSQRISNAVKPKLQEAVSRKHFQQVADLIKGHDSQEKRNELASHHAGIFAKQNPRFNAAKFHAAAGSTAHQEPKKMDEAKYSYKSARRGEDIGKPGKMFGKIAKKAGERYGSEERGKKVAGAILAKIRAKHMKEENLEELSAFGQEFAAARKAGQSQFMSKTTGKMTSTALKSGGTTAAASSPRPTYTPGTQGVATGKSFADIDKARNAAADKAASASIKSATAGTDYAKPSTPPAASKALGGTKWADQGARENQRTQQTNIAANKMSGGSSQTTMPSTAAKSNLGMPSSETPKVAAPAVAPTPPSRPASLGGSTSAPAPKAVDPGAAENKQRASGQPLKESVQIGENKYRIV